MATPVFDIGDGVRVTGTFIGLNGLTADPTNVVFRLRDPLGVVTTPNVIRLSAGSYYSDFVVNSRGTWTYRWEGTGTVIAAEEGRLAVRPSAFV
jgi:hypothetical protein